MGEGNEGRQSRKVDAGGCGGGRKEGGCDGF